MTLISFVSKTTAILVVLFAIAIMAIPRVLYTPLPADLTLDITAPTTMIITGANSGLGLATVQHFAHNEQATIIMACRSMTRCNNAVEQIYGNLGKDVVKANLRPMMLDLSKRSSVEAFAKELEGQPIDILVNNAGLAGSTVDLSFDETDGTGVETHLRVNHLGSVQLVHVLWSNLQLAPRGARIVVVSSLTAAPAANGPTLGWFKGEEAEPAKNIVYYGRSKRANLFFAQELQTRFGATKANNNNNNISVVAAHPGFTHTDLCKNGCKGKNKLGAYFANLKSITGIIKMTPEDGALSQSYAAVISPSQGAGAYIGPALGLVGEPKMIGRIDGSWHHASFSREESQALWDKSMIALGIEDFGNYQIPKEAEEEAVEEVQ